MDKREREENIVETTPYGAEIDAHMKTIFPNRTERVFYEKAEGELSVEIHLLETEVEGEFQVLYTKGMSGKVMNLPQEFLPEYAGLGRGELIVLLPAPWVLQLPEEGGADNRLWWPVNLMKYLAHLPHENNTWLGWGHTIPNSNEYLPYDESTKLCGAMLGALQEEISLLKCADGTQINFYTVIPLYKEEIDFKQASGTEALLAKMATLKGYGMILFADRPNVVLEGEI